VLINDAFKSSVSHDPSEISLI